MPPETMTPREWIEASAFETFQTRGYEGSSLADIAARLGISEAHLREHFPSKDDIIVWREPQARRTLLEACWATADDEPLLATARRCLLAVVEHWRATDPYHRERLKTLATIGSLRSLRLRIHARWRRDLAAALRIRTRHPIDEFELRLVGGVVMAAFAAAIDQWIEDPDAPSLTELVSRAFDQLGGGFGSGTGSS